jgi:hypothetical protein
MIHTAFLTDYTNRIYTLPAPNNNLKLFLGLCPGSEILTAVYESAPDDFYTNWYNYKFKNASRQFVLVEPDEEFEQTAIKLTQYLDVWKDLISKLNFIYEKESSPFRFESTIEKALIETLTQCKDRCEEILTYNFHSGNIDTAKFLIARETFNNILL